MMRYLLEDMCVGVFLASGLMLSVALILYSVRGIKRVCLDERDHDVPRDHAPSETRYRAEDEAWDIMKACWGGTPEEEGSK